MNTYSINSYRTILLIFTVIVYDVVEGELNTADGRASYGSDSSGLIVANTLLQIFFTIAILIFTLFLPYFIFFVVRRQLKESAERIGNIETILIYRVFPDKSLEEICSKIKCPIEIIREERRICEKLLEKEKLQALARVDTGAGLVDIANPNASPAKPVTSEKNVRGFTHVGTLFEQMENDNKMTFAGFLETNALEKRPVENKAPVNNLISPIPLLPVQQSSPNQPKPEILKPIAGTQEIKRKQVDNNVKVVTPGPKETKGKEMEKNGIPVTPEPQEIKGKPQDKKVEVNPVKPQPLPQKSPLPKPTLQTPPPQKQNTTPKTPQKESAVPRPQSTPVQQPNINPKTPQRESAVPRPQSTPVQQQNTTPKTPQKESAVPKPQIPPVQKPNIVTKPQSEPQKQNAAPKQVVAQKQSAVPPPKPVQYQAKGQSAVPISKTPNTGNQITPKPSNGQVVKLLPNKPAEPPKK